MYSAEGEEVQLSFSIYPSSNVEDWLREVERSMKTSVRDIIERAIKAYPTVSHASHPSIACQPSPPSVCSFLSALCSSMVAGLPACLPHPQAPALTDAALSQPGDLQGQGVLEACPGRNLKMSCRK